MTIFEKLGALVIVALLAGWFYWDNCTDAARAEARQAEAVAHAQAVADATPHVIRQADGCKVYAFKVGGTFHYFTRCGADTVTTDRNYTTTHREGKQTVTDYHVETIVTNGQQNPA